MAFRWMDGLDRAKQAQSACSRISWTTDAIVYTFSSTWLHSLKSFTRQLLPHIQYNAHALAHVRTENQWNKKHSSQKKKDDGMSLRLIMLLFFLSLLFLLSLLLFVSTWNAITLHHVQNSIQWNHCRIDHHLLSAVEKNAGLHSNCEIFTWKFESFPRNYLVQRVLAFSFTLLHFRQSSKVYGICMHTT